MSALGALRGLVGQSMGGSKQVALPLQAHAVTSKGSGTITIFQPGTAHLFLHGGQGSGASGGSAGGGGGGGALYKRFPVNKGDQISYSLGAGGAATNSGNGANGANSTVTLPNGAVVTAFGGSGGTTTAGGIAGSAIGGDINRRGGDGAVSPNAGLPSPDGTPGGVAGPSSWGGGAGATAGFADLIDGLGAGFSARGAAGTNNDGSGSRQLPAYNGVSLPGGGGGTQVSYSDAGVAGSLLLLVM